MLMLAAALSVAGLGQDAPAAETPPAAAPVAEVAAVPAPAPVVQLGTVLPRGTMVRLMVTKEVNSRDHKAGHRFKLRVDEDVLVDGVKLIPNGAIAWGEVTDVRATGGVGKSGKINARLLYVEAQGRQIPLQGERQDKGSGGGAQTAVSVLAFGPFGLLMKGNNATLKAGEILNGYTVADELIDTGAAAK
jgi:hypothetical protein